MLIPLRIINKTLNLVDVVVQIEFAPLFMNFILPYSLMIALQQMLLLRVS
jgi:hypothetical protein